MNPFKNIAIADDHNLILDGFEHTLKQHFPSVVIWKANNKTKLWDLLKNEPIELLFQDVLFGYYDAREFVTEIKTSFPHIKIVIISTLTDAMTINNLLHQGIEGYISKADETDELIKAIASLSQGELYLSPDVQKTLAISTPVKKRFVTQREEKVLRLIIQGLTSKHIAEQLNISIKTVETHRSNLFARFGVKNVVELVKKAIFEGYS